MPRLSLMKEKHFEMCRRAMLHEEKRKKSGLPDAIILKSEVPVGLRRYFKYQLELEFNKK